MFYSLKGAAQNTHTNYKKGAQQSSDFHATDFPRGHAYYSVVDTAK